MDIITIIEKKKNRIELDKQEIRFVIKGYLEGAIPDYQISAFLMAIWFNGMNYKEIDAMTTEMAHSGEIINLNSIPDIKVDKHSTGGVGDKTTIALIPMVAAAGVPVPKISGRALGYTGGTIDKLESIDGFQTNLSVETFINNVRKIKASVISASVDLAPADKKIYALRDVTGTTDSIPLIASSIMSKKIAGGADSLVLNVTVGDGAFIKTLSEGISLAKIMVDIGRSNNKKTYAIISSMEQPLGNAVGNSLEVLEAINLLNNNGPADLKELCLFLGAYMLMAGGVVSKHIDGIKILEEILSNGLAFKKFLEIVKAQHGNVEQISNPLLLPRSKYNSNVISRKEGIIKRIDAEMIGKTALLLGAGRKTKEDNIDHSVGIVLKKKTGDRVRINEPLATIYFNEENRYNLIENSIHKAFHFTNSTLQKKPLILKVIY